MFCETRKTGWLNKNGLKKCWPSDINDQVSFVGEMSPDSGDHHNLITIPTRSRLLISLQQHQNIGCPDEGVYLQWPLIYYRPQSASCSSATIVPKDLPGMAKSWRGTLWNFEGRFVIHSARRGSKWLPPSTFSTSIFLAVLNFPSPGGTT